MSLYLCSLLMIQTLYTHRISWLPLSLGGVWRGPLPVPGLGRRRGRAHVEAGVAAVARRLLGAAVAVPSTGVWGWLLVSGRIGTNGFNPTMCWILNFTPICSPGKWDDTLRILIDRVERDEYRLPITYAVRERFSLFWICRDDMEKLLFLLFESGFDDATIHWSVWRCHEMI